jgi:hypothetical protein
MTRAAAVGRSANAQDKHGERNQRHYDLDMLAIDLAAENGELGKFGIH